VSLPNGLTTAEAEARLERFGPNELAPPRRFEAVREIARFLVSPLVLVLLLASAVSAAFGQVVSSVIIALMVILSVVLNFTQAYRSQRAAQRLRERVGHTATVVRDGVARALRLELLLCLRQRLVVCLRQIVPFQQQARAARPTEDQDGPCASRQCEAGAAFLRYTPRPVPSRQGGR